MHDARKFKWQWKDLIASLCDEHIELLCHGSLVSTAADPTTVRSRGLVSCRVAFDQNSKDYAMVRMEKNKASAEMRTPEYDDWPKSLDFIFERSDGVQFTLHPQHNGNNILVKVMTTVMLPAPAPKAGMYSTDGPGTFQRGYCWNKYMDAKFKTPAR